jgi:predicted nucleotidyltransferase
MIPDFVDIEHFTVLPKGIHECTMNELKERFAISIRRRELMFGLEKLIEDLKKIYCTKVYIDGSFVTNKARPSDIDVLWDVAGASLDDLEQLQNRMPLLKASREEQHAMYGCDIFPARFTELGSGLLFIDFFQQIKYTNLPKGILKINVVL